MAPIGMNPIPAVGKETVTMKLHVRSGPEQAIHIKDTILFESIEVATATRGSFDSSPYAPRNQTWSYAAELHQTAPGEPLWVRVTEYEETVEVKGGDWVRSVAESSSLHTSVDGGVTWVRASEADVELGEETRLHVVKS